MSIQSGEPISSKLPILVSYRFLRDTEGLGTGMADIMLGCADAYDLLVDSGAFSEYSDRLRAAKKGTDQTHFFKVKDYIDYVKTNLEGRAWGYVALDVILDHKATMKNLDKMTAAGLQPIPVVVGNNSDLEDLGSMLDVNERLCVGGGVRSPLPWIVKRYLQVWEKSEHRAKIHALGFCRVPIAFKLPISTCDNSSFCSPGLYGQSLLYRLGKFEKMAYRDLLNPTSTKAVWFRSQYQKFGINIEQEVETLAARKNNVFNMNVAPAAFSYIQMSRRLALGGARYFFACTSVYWFLMVAAVLATSTEDRFDFNRSREIYTDWLGNLQAKRYQAVADGIASTIRGMTI